MIAMLKCWFHSINPDAKRPRSGFYFDPVVVLDFQSPLGPRRNGDAVDPKNWEVTKKYGELPWRNIQITIVDMVQWLIMFPNLNRTLETYGHVREC